MRFLRYALALTLVIPLAGCPVAATTPAQATAPGYLNATDQTLGETLAAISAFVTTESTVNYPAETPAQQAVQKPYLNALITLTNSASALYLQYHAGTATLSQVQTAVTMAQGAQTNLTNAKGIK